MKAKPITPYQRLLDAFRKFARAAVYPKRALTMSFNREAVARGDGFALRDLLQRIVAADQLGYTAEIKLTDTHLQVYLVQKRPEDMPWEVR